MRIATDINCFYNIYSIEETITVLKDAGFDTIDFTFMDERYYNGDIVADACAKHYAEVRRYAEDKGITFDTAHAPCPSSMIDEEATVRRFDAIVRSMKNASTLGAKTIVVHPLQHLQYSTPGAIERTFEMNMEFYSKLKPYCEEYDIRVALENLTDFRETLVGHRFFHTTCSTPDEFLLYMNELNSPHFVACLDIGHAIVVHQNPAEFITKLGRKRLQVLHVHDSDGHRDTHTLPYLGGMGNWAEITDALRSINFDGNFNFEAGNFLKPLPKELYPAGAKMLYSTGKYLEGRIKAN